MQTILYSIAGTSIVWLIVLCIVAIRNIAKNAKKDRQIKTLQYNVKALQIQYEEREKRYAKMQTGNTNNDFMASLDILRDAERNGGSTANAAATANNRRTRQ